MRNAARRRGAISSGSNVLRAVLCCVLGHAYMQAPDAEMQSPERDLLNPAAVRCALRPCEAPP